MPQISLKDLNCELKKENEISGLYLLYGEEKYLISKYTKLLIKKALGDEFLDFNFHKLTGENLDINFLADLTWTLPVMSDKKCVELDDLDISKLNKADVGKLNELIEELPETSVLIISLKTLEIDLKKSANWRSFINNVKKKGTVVEFSKLRENELVKQLVYEAKLQGSILNNKAAVKLVQESGTDLMNLMNELCKLCAYKIGGEILEDDVDKIAIKSLETTVYILAKSILAGKRKESFEQLDILLANKEEPIVILAILSSAYVDMFRVKVALNNGQDPAKLASKFASEYKGREFKIRNAERNAQRFSMKQLKESLYEFMQTDLKMKSTQIDKKILMQTLLTRLFLIREGEL